MSTPIPRPDWLLRLKDAADAGYYQEDSDEGQQTVIPFSDLRCGSCTWIVRGECLVWRTYRGEDGDTCQYYETTGHPGPNHADAERMVVENWRRDHKAWMARFKRS